MRPKAMETLRDTVRRDLSHPDELDGRIGSERVGAGAGPATARADDADLERSLAGLTGPHEREGRESCCSGGSGCDELPA